MSESYTEITVNPPGTYAARNQRVADGVGWDAFPVAPKAVSDSWDAFPEAKGKSLADTSVDVGKSLGTGIVKGTTALLGMVGDLSDFGAKGLEKATDFVTDQIGVDRYRPPSPDSRATSVLNYIPTNSSLQKNVESVIGPLHEPETTAGSYAEKIGEYVPAVLGSGAGLLRKAAAAVIPGAADESARLVTKGTDLEKYAGPAAGFLAGGATAILSKPGSAAQAIRHQLPEGITESDITAAGHLMQDAARRGIDLTWPEALSQTTKRPVLTDMQRILESSPETRSRMQGFFAERPQQFDRAALDEFDNVAAANARPSGIGPQVGKAAAAHVNDVRQAINRASDPYYLNAQAVLLTPAEMAHVRRIPGFQQARDAVRNNPQLNSYVEHLPDNSVGFLNEVKKYFDQQGKNAGSKLNPQANQQISAANDKAASALKQIGEAKSVDYGIALQIQDRAREQYLQPLLDGPLGRLAKKDVTTRKAINALFPENPLPNSHREIAEAVGALSKKNQYAATQLVRAHLESAFNEATRSLQGGLNQYGAANFAKAVVGNVQQRENLRAAIEALPNGNNIWAGFEGFLEAAQASGTRQPRGSLTSFNTADRKLLEGSGAIGEAVKTGLSPGKWWSVVNDKWSKWKLGNNLHELATIFTNPASGKILQRIATMPTGSREAQFLAARLISQTEQAISNSRDAKRQFTDMNDDRRYQ